MIIGLVLIIILFSVFNFATRPVNLQHVNKSTSLYILKDKLDASNVTTRNITSNGNIGFTVGVSFIHNLTIGYYHGLVLYVMLFNSNENFPLTNVGFRISDVSITSNLLGLNGYTEINNATVETILLNNVPSTIGNGTLKLTFTLTPVYEFLLYHYSGKPVIFTFYQNVTVIN